MQKRAAPYVIRMDTVYVNKTRQTKDRKCLYHIVLYLNKNTEI
jgi:hypothetical protein